MSEQRLRTADLLLVSMPFGPQTIQPSLALSLLKAEVAPLGISSRVLYFTLKFAQRIGLRLYADVAYTEPTIHGFVGDWVFNAALFESLDHDEDGYVNDILRGHSQDFREARDNLLPVSEKVIAEMLDVRSKTVAFLDECLEEVLRHRPRIVGFTSTFQQHVAALALARRIKQEAPETFVVFGGANCEGVMGVEMVRQFGFVDAVVSGEADLVFPDLVQRVLEGRSHQDLPGVNTRQNSGFSPLGGAHYSHGPMVRDMDALPYPEFDDFFEQFAAIDLGLDKTAHRPRLMFETSRGCWWGEKAHCTFCGLNGGTMTFRAKSEQRALAELLYLHERFPGCSVSVTDNILDMKYFKNFVPELAAREIDLELFYEIKANLRKDQIKLLRDAGIMDIQPGIESFSDPVLELMRKGIKGLQNIQLLKWCKEYGVRPHWNMLWGFPGEPPEEYARVADLIPLLVHLPPAGGGGIIRLDRFSPNFDHAEELGFADVAPYPAYHYIYPLPPDVVANLAYFFTYRYREPRDIQSYTGPIRERMSAWKKAHESSDLFSVDKGTQLLIWDLRPMAKAPLTVLAGILRRVYLACDGICSLSRIREIVHEETGEGLAAEQIDELLWPLIDRGLMIREGFCCLALAIPLGEYSPSEEVAERLQQVISQLGETSGDQVRIKLPACLDGSEVIPAAVHA